MSSTLPQHNSSRGVTDSRTRPKVPDPSTSVTDVLSTRLRVPVGEHGRTKGVHHGRGKGYKRQETMGRSRDGSSEETVTRVPGPFREWSHESVIRTVHTRRPLGSEDRESLTLQTTPVVPPLSHVRSSSLPIRPLWDP